MHNLLHRASSSSSPHLSSALRRAPDVAPEVKKKDGSLHNRSAPPQPVVRRQRHRGTRALRRWTPARRAARHAAHAPRAAPKNGCLLAVVAPSPSPRPLRQLPRAPPLSSRAPPLLQQLPTRRQRRSWPHQTRTRRPAAARRKASAPSAMTHLWSLASPPAGTRCAMAVYTSCANAPHPRCVRVRAHGGSHARPPRGAWREVPACGARATASATARAFRQ
jgi:hypothetical protein